MIPSPFGVTNVDGSTLGNSYGAPRMELLITKPDNDVSVRVGNIGVIVGDSVGGSAVAEGGPTVCSARISTVGARGKVVRLWQDVRNNRINVMNNPLVFCFMIVLAEA